MLSSSKGQLALLQIQIRAAQKDIICSLPTNNEGSYDILLDIKNENKIYRGQVKYCNRGGKYKNTLKLALDNKRSKRKFYSNKDIDIILVFVPKLNEILCYKSEFFHKKTYIDIHLTNKNSKWYFENFIW